MAKEYTKTSKGFSGVIVERGGMKEWQANHPIYLRHEINKYKAGDKVTCYYTQEKLKRTEAQNRYYWGAYLPMISAETGNDIDDLHTLFKGMFLSKGIVEVLGHKVRQAKSTTELTAGQFSEYISRIEELTGVLAPPTMESEEEPKEIDYPEGPDKTAFDD